MGSMELSDPFIEIWGVSFDRTAVFGSIYRVY